MSAQAPYSTISGNVIRIRMSFTDDNNTLADPTLVTCFVGLPGSVSTELVPIRIDTGLYYADWDTTGVESGLYFCVASGSGAVVAAHEIAIRIKASAIPV